MSYGLSDSANALLGKVQNIFGAGNVSVTSGRSNRVGVAGGSATSQHPSGNAFDFHVAGYTPDQVQSIIGASGIQFGQSIQEYGAAAGAGLNHLGVGTKGQLLTGKNGKYTSTGFAAVAGGGLGSGTFGDWIAKTFGNTAGNISDQIGQNLKAPGDAIDSAVNSATQDWGGWFGRITLGILALLLIAVGLFMLSGRSVSDVAPQAGKLLAA
jgi:hypothetical protein